MSQRRISPLLIGAIALAVLAPLGFAAWMVLGARREAEDEARVELQRAIVAPPVGRTIPVRPGGPSHLMMAPPPAVKLALPAIPPGGEAAQLAAIDRSARERAAAQAGLTPDEARRVEQIHLESDRRRQEIENRSEWASDEDLTALHDNATAEQTALQSQLGPQRAQLLHTAEQDSYRRILGENAGRSPVVNRRLQLLRLGDGASKAVGTAPPGQTVEEDP